MMTGRRILVLLAVMAASEAVLAQSVLAQVVLAQAPAGRRPAIGEFGGANNNKPINIEADKLEVYQKEGRAVYTGNIVAVQGETTMKCSQLIVFFDQSQGGGPAAGPQSDSLKKLECKGPVSVVAKSEGKSQTATGDNAIYDRVSSIVTMTGNVTLADSGNVTNCQTFTYNTNSGQANCAAPPGGRVRGIFLPNESGPAAPRRN